MCSSVAILDGDTPVSIALHAPMSKNMTLNVLVYESTYYLENSL